MTKKKSTQGPAKRRTAQVRRGVPGGHDGLPGSAPEAPRRAAPAAAPETDDAALVAGVRAGDRGALARAITLIESQAASHIQRAQAVLQALLPYTGSSIRVGVTGVPGAGKSTLIEMLGLSLIAAGHKVAVTAVDPSSSVSGGSILGDKTRMDKLATADTAFIRPSPSGGTLGGVARKTRETILLFEAAGYDVVLIETIGVGQSEIVVRSMVDFFLLVLIPGGGDELQGIKRGVIELADAVLINKADGDNLPAAAAARAEYAQALKHLRPATPGWQTRVHQASALTGSGIGEIWRVVEAFRECTVAAGVFARRRREQGRDWMLSLVRERLWDLFRAHPAVAARLHDLEDQVMRGELTAAGAAEALLAAFES